MITKIINEEKYYEIEESGDIVVSSETSNKGVINDNTTFEIISPEFEGKELPLNPLRIEAELTAEWSGVRDCYKVSRLRSNVDKVAKSWIKNQLFERRHLKFVRYGGVYANGRYSNGRFQFPDRRRYCGGSCTFTIYIEFTSH